jgi:hypothetical protein
VSREEEIARFERKTHPVKFSDDGATFGGQFISNQTSNAAPALASDGSQVPIAWKGNGNNSLSVAQFAFFSYDSAKRT